MTTKSAPFTIKPFKYRNGMISFRVAGWLCGQRIRKNFKSREDAIIERGTLQLKQAQVASSLHLVPTFLTEAQVREAEGVFAKLTDSAAPRSLSFYASYGLANHHEPKSNVTIAEAVAAYLAERGNDLKQALICQRQLDALRNELDFFNAYFPQKLLSDLTAAKLLDYIRRGSGSSGNANANDSGNSTRTANTSTTANTAPNANRTASSQPSLKTQNNRRAVLFTLCKYACAQGWLAANPLADIKRHRIESARGSAEAQTAAQAAALMAHVETLADGALVPYFALCLFAGIRPEGEIAKLPAADVRLDNNAIIIEPSVSKVDMRRIVAIQPNLAAWLRAYPLDQFPIMPPRDKIKNFAGKLSQLRKQFALGHDVLRHTFISMHVAKFRSIGDTSLQAGNSERIIRKHYLNVTTPQEAEAFFSILPNRQPAAKPTPTPTPATPAPASTPSAALAQTASENADAGAANLNTNTAPTPAESHQLAA